MSGIEHDHWVCPRCDSVDGPTSGNLCDVCAYDDGATQEVVGLVSADAYRGAVARVEALEQGIRVFLAAEHLAKEFHDTYERLAPEYGYETREASAVPWADVPEQNKALMMATVEHVMAGAVARYEALRHEVREVAESGFDEPENWS